MSGVLMLRCSSAISATRKEDLADVTLVNREAIGFLSGVEAAGATLVNCPEYVRRWIEAEHGDA
jgi:hypothetical protein